MVGLIQITILTRTFPSILSRIENGRRGTRFNFKLWQVAMQKKNSPLPPTKYIIPMACSECNKTKPGSGINTQMLWQANFVSPVAHPKCALVKQLAVLQQGREAAWGGTRRGFLPTTTQAQFSGDSQINQSISDATGTLHGGSVTSKEETASDESNAESGP